MVLQNSVRDRIPRFAHVAFVGTVGPYVVPGVGLRANDSVFENDDTLGPFGRPRGNCLSCRRQRPRKLDEEGLRSALELPPCDP